MLPNRLLLDRIFLISDGSLDNATPPIRSLNPERYLVAEYKTKSAPNWKGCWNAGPIIVLSTMTSGFSPGNAADQSTHRRISVIMPVGFAGVSISTTRRFFAE